MIINKDMQDFLCLHWLTEYLSGHNGFICGGCFKHIFLNEKVKDLDVFFENEFEFEKARQHFDDSDDFHFYYENKNVVAYINDNQIVVELNRKVFGKPQEILNQFDFTITKFALYKRKKNDGFSYEILCHEHFFEHLFLKKDCY